MKTYSLPNTSKFCRSGALTYFIFFAFFQQGFNRTSTYPITSNNETINFTFNSQDNYSDGTSSIEICDNGIDDDGDGLIDAEDSDCFSEVTLWTEICDNGRDDDGDGLIDSQDDDCAYLNNPEVEICDNGIDDDYDGLTDWEDSDCIASNNRGAFQFKIQLVEQDTTDFNVWGVYVKPVRGFGGSDTTNVVASGQITIIMEHTPALDSIHNIQSIHGVWNDDYDIHRDPPIVEHAYFFVGLSHEGAGIPLKNHQETLLFTFQTTQTCPDILALFDNNTNPYKNGFPKLNSNPGIDLAVFNTSSGEIYNWLGNYGHYAYDCKDCDNDGIPNGIEDENGNIQIICDSYTPIDSIACDLNVDLGANQDNCYQTGVTLSATILGLANNDLGGTCSRTTISNFPYSESFENTLGAWSQSTSEDIDWTNYSGPTTTGSTGPSEAADGSNYNYLEASIAFSKTAILNSPCFDLSGISAADFTFQYHMYGRNIGSLEVEASTDNGATWTKLWGLSGDQSNQWHTANINLDDYAGGMVQLRFVGKTGPSYRSDIAIDDIQLITSIATNSLGSENATYVWSTGDSTSSITVNPLTTTTYFVSVSMGGCTTSDQVTVIGLQNLDEVRLIQPSCPSLDNGSINIIATGEDLLYSIDHALTFQDSPVFTGLSEGHYGIVIKNSITDCTLINGDSVILSNANCIEICDNNIDDDGDGLTDAADSDCSSVTSLWTEICDNFIDDDGDGLIDAEDDDCNYLNSSRIEICDNFIDDDGDGLIDWEDSDCIAANDDGAFNFKIQLFGQDSTGSNVWGVYVKPVRGFDGAATETVTASGQITIIMENTPTLDAIHNIQSIHGEWYNYGVDEQENYVYRDLDSGPPFIEHAYFFIGLQDEGAGIPLLNYQETLLFTFQTTQACPDILALYDNNTNPHNDAFISDLNINAGMDLAVFNTRTGKIYNWLGNYGYYAYDCKDCDNDGIPNGIEDEDGNINIICGGYNPIDSIACDLHIDDVRLIQPTNCPILNNGSISIIATGDDLLYSIDHGITFQDSNVFTDLREGNYGIVVKNAITDCSLINGDSIILVNPICVEICDNNIDDDGDGYIDCEDSDCGRPTISNLLTSHPNNCSLDNGEIIVEAEGNNLEFTIDGGITYQFSNVFDSLEEGAYFVLVRSTTNGCSTAYFDLVHLWADSSMYFDDADLDGLTDCEELTGIDNPYTPVAPLNDSDGTTSDPFNACDPFIKEIELTCPPDISVSCNESLDSILDFTWPTAAYSYPMLNTDSIFFTYQDSTFENSTNNWGVIRNWQATDVCGNQDNCTWTINIKDDIAPQIDCIDRMIFHCLVDPKPVIPTRISDNCSLKDSLVLSYADQITDICGVERDILRLWTVEDEAGNQAICRQWINIIDTIAPVINCPPAISIPCSQIYTPTLADYPIALDHCGRTDTSLVTYEDTTLDMLDPCNLSSSEIVRTWKAVDVCGNESTCQQSIFLLNEQQRVHAKLYLEGFYDPTTEEMHTRLKDNNLLPTYQPYWTAPWNYIGTDSVFNFPTNVVDWVLIMSRDSSGQIIDQSIGFVNTTGDLVATDGTLGIPLLNAIGHTISIHHRSHLAILSATTYEGDVLDFTQAAQAALGNNQLKEIEGKYVLYAGDYDASGIINSIDLNLWKLHSAAVYEYLSTDGDGNSIVNSLDYNLWTRNQSKIGEPLIRY